MNSAESTDCSDSGWLDELVIDGSSPGETFPWIFYDNEFLAICLENFFPFISVVPGQRFSVILNLFWTCFRLLLLILPKAHVPKYYQHCGVHVCVRASVTCVCGGKGVSVCMHACRGVHLTDRKRWLSLCCTWTNYQSACICVLKFREKFIASGHVEASTGFRIGRQFGDGVFGDRGRGRWPDLYVTSPFSPTNIRFLSEILKRERTCTGAIANTSTTTTTVFVWKHLSLLLVLRIYIQSHRWFLVRHQFCVASNPDSVRDVRPVCLGHFDLHVSTQHMQGVRRQANRDGKRWTNQLPGWFVEPKPFSSCWSFWATERCLSHQHVWVLRWWIARVCHVPFWGNEPRRFSVVFHMPQVVLRLRHALPHMLPTSTGADKQHESLDLYLRVADSVRSTLGDGNWDSSVNLCYSPMKFGLDIVHMSKKIQVQQDEKRPVGLPQRRQNPNLSATYTVCRLQQKRETAVKSNIFHASPCW